MKKKIIIYCFSILLSFLIITYLSLKFFPVNTYKNIDDVINDCHHYLELTNNLRLEYDNKYPGLYSVEKCNYIVDSANKPVSFFFVFDSVATSGIIRFIIPFFIPILLLFPIIYRLSLEFKSGFIKYYLLRMKYREYIFHIFKISYKYIFLIIFIILFLIVGSIIVSKSNFNPTLDIYLNYIDDFPLVFYKNTYSYIIYFVVIVLNLLLYINIALIVLRNNSKNFLISYAESFLLIYLWWCFTFIIVGRFLQKTIGILSEEVNILEIYTWHSISNPNIFLIINIIYYLISLLIVLLLYKNKEKLILKCEGQK